MSSDAPVKIASLEVTNFKRIRAIEMELGLDGLTVIGGANAQGKTSVLDAIMWALGGERHRPGQPNRDGGATNATIRVELSNGLVAERRGKNGDLKVTDPEGKRAGQRLLDGFLDELALNLPKFLDGTDKSRADALLEVIGVGEELARLDAAIASRYEERKAVGRDATRKRKAAEDMPSFEDAPAEPVSVADLVREQQGILARNGENQRKRMAASEMESRARSARRDAEGCASRVGELERLLATARDEFDASVRRADEAERDAAIAQKTAAQLEDESTEEIEASIASIELINDHVTANRRKAEAEEEAKALEAEYSGLTAEVERLRGERMALLDGADLPLPGLSVEGGTLAYMGHAWEDMSGSDQLRVATAIVRRVKPSCGFVLVDKLEQMDLRTLAEFARWAESEGLQVIGTRVSEGDECTVVIEDGRVRGADVTPDAPEGDAIGWDGGPEVAHDYGEEW